MGLCASNVSDSTSNYHDSPRLTRRQRLAFGDTPIGTPPRLRNRTTLEQDYLHRVCIGEEELLPPPRPVMLIPREGRSPQRLALRPPATLHRNKKKSRNYYNICDEQWKQCCGDGYEGRKTKWFGLFHCCPNPHVLREPNERKTWLQHWNEQRRLRRPVLDGPNRYGTTEEKQEIIRQAGEYDRLMRRRQREALKPAEQVQEEEDLMIQRQLARQELETNAPEPARIVRRSSPW